VLPFSRPTPQEDDKEPALDVEIDEEEVRAWPWLQELRKLVKADSYDKPGLQQLNRSDDFCGKTLAGYALYLLGRKRFKESTVHKYVFLIANRLMLKVAGQDEERGSETWQRLLADQIAWEDLIEQVLDDAYYHRRRFSGSIDREAAAGPDQGESGMPDAESGGSAAESPVADAVESSAQTPESPSAGRDAAGYSRALLKALGNFVEYLNRGRQASEELTTKLPPAGMIRVDATMITVDEFRLEVTDNVLYLAGVLEMPVPAVAKSTGLDELTVLQIARNLESVSQMKSPKDNTTLYTVKAFRGASLKDGSVMGCHPLLPRGAENVRGFSAIFASKLNSYIEYRGDNARTTLGYVARSMLPGRPCIAFRQPDPNTVGDCLEHFRRLGVHQEQMAGFSCDGTENKFPTERWLNRWGLSRRWRKLVVNQHGRGRLLQSPTEWLILEPNSLGRDQTVSDATWLRVLQYILLMAYIRFDR
jgi:hypothetical protein